MDERPFIRAGGSEGGGEKRGMLLFFVSSWTSVSSWFLEGETLLMMRYLTRGWNRDEGGNVNEPPVRNVPRVQGLLTPCRDVRVADFFFFIRNMNYNLPRYN